MAHPPTSAPPAPRRRRRGAWTVLAVSSATLAAVALYAHYRLTPGLILLARLGDADPGAERAGLALVEATVHVPGVGPVRTYAPVGGAQRAALLIHGVHHAGPDEPRFIAAARKLAGMGLAIATPRIEELARADVDRGALDRIERAALWLAQDSQLGARGEPIGLVGICFGGGLALAAAGREPLAPHVAYVLALGAYDALDLELSYLATGRGADGVERPPDPYGQAVVLRILASRMVPPDQVSGLREALAAYLADDHAAARARLATLGEPARTLGSLPLTRDTRALGQALLPYLPTIVLDPSLSPTTAPLPHCPVFLLHAAGDIVMLPEHSVRLAARLGPHTPTRLLVTPLFEHVDPSAGGAVGEMLALGEFLTDFLRR